MLNDKKVMLIINQILEGILELRDVEELYGVKAMNQVKEALDLVLKARETSKKIWKVSLPKEKLILCKEFIEYGNKLHALRKKWNESIVEYNKALEHIRAVEKINGGIRFDSAEHKRYVQAVGKMHWFKREYITARKNAPVGYDAALQHNNKIVNQAIKDYNKQLAMHDEYTVLMLLNIL